MRDASGSRSSRNSTYVLVRLIARAQCCRLLVARQGDRMRMNKHISATSIGFALGLFAAASIAMADETVTTKTETTTYTGTVSQLDPASSTIILKSESSPTPVTYTYTKDTSFVDSTGKVVTYEAVRNSPVRVEYSNVGGQVVV